MMMGRAAVFFAILAASQCLGAEERDPVSLIGLDLKSAFDAFGPPQEVFACRGAEDWQDNVVFFYPDCTYLFWYKNRVWQVRCDGRYRGTPFGLPLGMSREEVRRKIDRPLQEQGDSLFFDVDDGKYPLRVRLVFSGSGLSDVYVYRSDF